MPQVPQYRGINQASQMPRQAFHNPRTSYGVGHWIKTAGILAPFIIGELVKDPDKRWRLIRGAAVATALLSEGMYTHHIRKEREEARAHARACFERA